ncbi:MAG: hypothetical protein B6U73_00625 [Desulfurococcales archaeon ex4484_204]|nr:MAG: hypothetical protein B6U73_00625 [Desulfurococcales archaeon ex4484_204]
MLCPYCRSRELFWDYERGEVICVRCGSVVDRIYYYDRLTNQETLSIAQAPKRTSRALKPKPVTMKYLKLLSRVKKLSNVFIDNEAFMEYATKGGPHVKILKRPFNEELLNDSNVKTVLKIMSKYPRLSSRTERAKLALALLTLALLNSSYWSLNAISSNTGLSKVHVRRLLNLLRSERDFVREVKGSLVRP